MYTAFLLFTLLTVKTEIWVWSKSCYNSQYDCVEWLIWVVIEKFASFHYLSICVAKSCLQKCAYSAGAQISVKCFDFYLVLVISFFTILIVVNENTHLKWNYSVEFLLFHTLHTHNIPFYHPSLPYHPPDFPLPSFKT